MQGGPAHDAAVLADWQTPCVSVIRAADGGVFVQLIGGFVQQAERSVIGLNEFECHIEDLAQRIVQMQARTDQAAGVLQALQFVDLALQRAVDALILARVVNGDGGQLHERVEDQEFMKREVPIGIQAKVQRPDRLARHQQRITRGGANARLEFERMKGDVRFFVRQHAGAARQRGGANASGTRRIVDERAIAFAGRDARSGFKRARDWIARVDDGVGVIGWLRIDQVQGGRGDELQRFIQRCLRAKAADLGAGIAQDEQGALEIGVGVVVNWVMGSRMIGATLAVTLGRRETDPYQFTSLPRVYPRDGWLSMERGMNRIPKSRRLPKSSRCDSGSAAGLCRFTKWLLRKLCRLTVDVVQCE